MNIGEHIDFELGQAQKRLIIDGVKVGSVYFMLGKMKIMDDLVVKYGLEKVAPKHTAPRLHLEKPMDFWLTLKCRFAVWVHNKGFMRNDSVLAFLKKHTNLPSVFLKQWSIELNGLKFTMDERDYRMSEILRDYQVLVERGETWEPETTKIVEENVKEGMTCVDIGASVGYFTLLFGKMVGPTGKVISVEPTEMNYVYLCQNIGLNGFWDRCRPYKVAAWDTNEVVKIPINSPVPIWANGLAVDDVLELNGTTKVDFIKMDVDGPEPRALKGLVRTFERNPQLKMVIEYYPRYIDAAGCSPKEFMDTLNKYFTYTIIPSDYTEGCWNLFCKRK